MMRSLDECARVFSEAQGKLKTELHLKTLKVLFEEVSRGKIYIKYLGVFTIAP